MTISKFDPQKPFDCFVVQSEAMKSAVENAKRFAMFDVPLLIQGETGTGKDLLAKACHYQSLRRDKKFIAVNCAGLPDEDAESEMFGRKVGDSETIGFLNTQMRVQFYLMVLLNFHWVCRLNYCVF